MVKNKDILADSCIINNLLSNQKELAKETAEYFNELIEAGNRLYASEFTHHEIFRGLAAGRKQKAEVWLEKFEMVPHSKIRLERATRLSTAYSDEPSIKAYLPKISDIDIFLGALIFTDRQPLLLTADFNDFPRPFFSEVENRPIVYNRNKGNKCCLYYYLLQANLDSIPS